MTEERSTGAPDCAVCRELTIAESEAEGVGDHSRAVDCRVLRRRHARGHEGG
ncbi:hypothetical protein ACFVIM_16350 [Streptomyces sp. NPDC057638]|uniref:hypothetical protein n=1 Tax=Streptomyces sp. NPDC057638 TaxID=3346190 RepID=UPI0036A0A89D